MAGLATADAQHRGRYFVGPVVDFMVMGGLSLALYPLLSAIGGSVARTEQANTIVIALWWVCNWPHFSATNYRLYSSRANVAQYPITALVIPVLVVAATVASFLSPRGVAPYFVKLVVSWSIYHFAGQTLGLTMIYARRAGIAIGSLERQALFYCLMGTFLGRLTADEHGTTPMSYFGIEHARLGTPEWLAPALVTGALGCGALFIARLVTVAVREKRAVPAILFLPVISYFIWFIPGYRSQYFYAFVPFFHSLQYMLIAWAMQLKEKLDTEKITPSRSYVLKESLRWGGINLVGGAMLFFVLPKLGEITGATSDFSFAVVATAVQLHHFFVDGVIWKLKNPKVSSPLLVHLGEMIHPPAAAPVLEKKAA